MAAPINDDSANDDSAIILFAHGARDPQWAEPFHAIRERVRAARPGVPVEIAFLEIMTPTLATVVSQLAASGPRRITVVPLFMARGGHLKQDLVGLLDEIRKKHPDLLVKVTPALGEAPEMLQSIADWVVRAAT